MSESQDTIRRAALVTGSSRGIGLAVADHLAAAGFNVALNCSSEAGLPALSEQAGRIASEHGVQVEAVAASVADEAEAQLFKITDVDEIDWKTALKIGCFQVLAIIPGTSRSGATIIGGMLSGCSRTAAAEFTFFLAIPIMFGWGLVKCLKFFAAGLAMTMTEVVVLAVGIVTAFVMSVIAIKFLMGYIKKNDFTVFGWYRIVVGVLVLGYFVFESMGMLP